MKLCRFATADGGAHPGLTLDGVTILDLSAVGVRTLGEVLEEDDPLRHLEALSEHTGRAYRLTDVRLLAPVDRQEVWAAGVTYQRSRKARTAESEHDATAYERVYEAQRPELFFKALASKVVGPGEAVGVRRDSRWSVPEPELALVINSRGRVVGVTIGNDMSARDIEGENLLYLPQAKVYDRSCALGPWIEVGWTEERVRSLSIRLTIQRAGGAVFEGETCLGNLKRSFADLVAALRASQTFPHGAVLLTGTGVIPPDDFSLEAGDLIRIEVPGLEVLENPVVAV